MKISAVLLVGGESHRMGQDKATIIFRGKPLWQIQLDLLRKLDPVEIFISARTDPPWRPSDMQFVWDDPPSRGPLSGLRAALAQIQTGHLLALAIDMPFMSEDYLRAIGNEIGPGCGVLPMIGDRAEPLAAIYPAHAHVDLVEALSGIDFSFQTLTNKLVKTGKLRALNVVKEEEMLFRNLNEPADLDSSQ
ncbi:MAG: molybdenum cofactor guanylyltransferase [Chthoniobacterales bacterium]